MSSGLLNRGLVGLVSSVWVVGVWAQPAPTGFTRRPMPSTPCTTPPVIDGDLSDAAWKSAGKAESFVDRANGNVVGDQTVAYITYDAKFVYVAYDCYDSDPQKVEARETIRDSKYANRGSDDNPNKEDNVTFSIDPYFSKKSEDVSVFSVNAIGTPSAVIAGGRGGKLEWKGQWEAAAKRTEKGYAVEMRIPWRS